MQFKNLTPFDALAFGALDKRDRHYHVVVMCVGYQLHHDARTGLYEALLIEQDPLPLVLADEHWGEPASSSLKAQSDLLPYKPQCDVLVTGHAHCARAQQRFDARLQVQLGAAPQLDKTLQLSGPCHLLYQSGFGGSVLSSPNLSRSYRLQPAQATQQVPLRYELAFGGACVLADERHLQDPQRYPQPYRINEVCYRNSVGAGWVEAGYLQALSNSPQGLPQQLPAPQIMLRGEVFERLVQTQQSGAMDAKQMAQQDYKHTAAGFGPLARAWAPRLALAGTYDETWLKTRHPGLPQDFDYRFYNCAPEDQQIPFPDLMQGLTLETFNLQPGGGSMRTTLPQHRAFVLADLGGARMPLPMQVDTLEINSDTLQVRTVWRAAMLKIFEPKSMELRFEVNPKAPLLKYKEMA